MELNLADDLERVTYFLGRYYDLDLQMLLDMLLSPGDTFMDIGANIGMATLHGASRVTSEGNVIAFEPQPACCRKIARNLMLNAINHVAVHNVGLADKDDELTLIIPGGGTIMAHISELNSPSDARQIRIPVRRGDDFVDKIRGRLVIKIDVEGYELHALRGLIKTINSYRPPIISELNPFYLQRAGADGHQAIRFFHDLDYIGYGISLHKAHPFSLPSVRLHQIDGLTDPFIAVDFLWLPAGDTTWQSKVSQCLSDIMDVETLREVARARSGKTTDVTAAFVERPKDISS
jgi:FkbM family methyltransferase